MNGPCYCVVDGFCDDSPGCDLLRIRNRHGCKIQRYWYCPPHSQQGVVEQCSVSPAWKKQWCLIRCLEVQKVWYGITPTIAFTVSVQDSRAALALRRTLND